MERGSLRGRGGGRGRGRGGFGGGPFNQAGQINAPLVVENFSDEDRVAVKLKGLPFAVRLDEISSFFKDHGLIDKSIVLGQDPNGKKNGFGAILFETRENAEKAAKDLNREYIGTRFVELSVIKYGDYSKFNSSPQGDNNKNGSSAKDIVNLVVDYDNMERALVMRGCPWKITPEEICTFFDGFGTIKAEDI